MKDFRKIFIDTTPLIYFLDNNPEFGAKARQIIEFLLQEDKIIASSVITCAEYLVVPYRKNELERVDSFWKYVTDSKMIMYPIKRLEAIKAAKIRSEYKYFKTMDSLQLAVAVLHDCDLFLTNDKQLKQFKEISCVTVEEWDL